VAATPAVHCEGMDISRQAFRARTGAVVSRISAALGCAAVCAVLVTGLAGPASASAGIGVQLLDGSAPDTSWMQASIPQGGSRTWHVKISNAGTTTETVAGIPSAALTVYSGGPAAQPAGMLQSWITGTWPATVLAPGQSMTATVTVTVPDNAPLGLVAGHAPGSAALSVNTFWGYAYPAGGQVQLASAAGVRMYITVTAGT
jgi:hypothetical protein